MKTYPAPMPNHPNLEMHRAIVKALIGNEWHNAKPVVVPMMLRAARNLELTECNGAAFPISDLETQSKLLRHSFGADVPEKGLIAISPYWIRWIFVLPDREFHTVNFVRVDSEHLACSFKTVDRSKDYIWRDALDELGYLYGLPAQPGDRYGR